MRVLGQALVVFVTAIATFLPSLNNGLLSDDVLLLDARVNDPQASPATYFRESYWGDLHNSGLYRPLSLAALSVQRWVFERNPAPYRIVNLLLHGACSVLVLFLLLRLTSSGPAFTGALLFAVHPIHAEAVITIYGQQDLLAALFFLAAVVGALEFSTARARAVRAPLVSASYLLSLLCKEQGVLLPLLLPVLRRHARVPAEDHFGGFQRADVALLIPLAVYTLLRIAVLGSQMVPSDDASVAYGYPWWARINLAMVTVGTYLRLLVLPWGQTTYYGHLRDSIFGWPVLEFAALGAAALLFTPLRQLVGRRVVVPAYAFLGVTLLPVANVLPIGVVVAERCLYLPAFAVCLILPAVIHRAAATRARVRAVVVSALVLAGALLSLRVAVRWQTPLSHWETTLSDHPRSAGAHARFALLLLQQAAPDKASADLRLSRVEQAINRASQINPRLPEAWQARGILALRRGDCATATAALERALALRPDSAEIRKLLGACR
jgi:hypothetical protein